MSSKVKSNSILYISFILLFSLLIYNSYEFIKNDINIKKSNEEMNRFCLKNEYNDTKYQNVCERILNTQENKLDFFTMITEIVVFGFNKLYFTAYLFVIVPSLFFICKYFKNKIVLNDLTRNNYKQIIMRLFRKAYKSALIFPSIVLIAYIISYVYTKNFDSTYAILNLSTGWSEYSLNHPIIFILLYLINIIIHSFLYINISLCIARKHHNYFVAVILSFLTFIGIESFFEIVINGILFITLLNSDYGSLFNIMNMFSFNDNFGILSPIYIPFIGVILSFIILYFLYKNKEKLIVDCEKN